jgi:hypothetical protein
MSNVTPFSKAYVLDTTMNHMHRAISISVKKTLGRLAEFEGNAAKGTEIMETLSNLQTMGKLLDNFKANNPSLFAKE